MSTSEPVRFSVILSTSSAERLEGLVSASGLPRATLARFLLERILRDPAQVRLLELPPRPPEQSRERV